MGWYESIEWLSANQNVCLGSQRPWTDLCAKLFRLWNRLEGWKQCTWNPFTIPFCCHCGLHPLFATEIVLADDIKLNLRDFYVNMGAGIVLFVCILVLMFINHFSHWIIEVKGKIPQFRFDKDLNRSLKYGRMMLVWNAWFHGIKMIFVDVLRKFFSPSSSINLTLFCV